MTHDEWAHVLREKLDMFITRDGEWNTGSLAEAEIAAAFAEVERETWGKVVYELGRQMEREGISTDDQVWLFLDWCCTQEKGVKG